MFKNDKQLILRYFPRYYELKTVLLVACGCCEQIHRTDGLWYSAEYSTFSISDEASKYQLTVDGYSGDAGNAIMSAQWPNWVANGMLFTTPDSDNDNRPNDNCGRAGGWWYWWWRWL